MAKRRARTRQQSNRPEYTLGQTVFVVVLASVIITVVLGGQNNLLGQNSAWLSGQDAAAAQFTAAAGRPVTSTVALICKDTEGMDYTTKGTCTWQGGVHTDYCFDANKLVEYQCAGIKCVQNLVDCPALGFTGCMDGACTT